MTQNKHLKEKLRAKLLGETNAYLTIELRRESQREAGQRRPSDRKRTKSACIAVSA